MEKSHTDFRVPREPQTRKSPRNLVIMGAITVWIGSIVWLNWPLPTPTLVTGGLNLEGSLSRQSIFSLVFRKYFQQNFVDSPQFFVRGPNLLIVNPSSHDWFAVYIVLNPGEGERGLGTSMMPGEFPKPLPGYDGYLKAISVVRAKSTVTVPLSQFKTGKGTYLNSKLTSLTRISMDYSLERDSTSGLEDDLVKR